MLATFLEDIRDGDMIAPKRMAARLRVPLTQLSRLAHVNRNTLTAKAGSPAVQERLGEIAHRGLAIKQARQQPATRGVRERGENEVQQQRLGSGCGAFHGCNKAMRVDVRCMTEVAGRGFII